MTSFGWKRKIGQTINKCTKKAFESNSRDSDDDLEQLETEGIDWLTLAPRRKVICIEDSIIKSARLKKEGTSLAELERFWEAIKKWDEALLLTPDDETLYEMKAQVYILLSEVFPAVTSAEKVVSLNPRWWEGHQTLGRAHLGLGEVRMAIKSFSKAVHINPSNEGLWKEDLLWAVSLLHRKKNIENQSKVKISKIVELTNTGGELPDDRTQLDVTPVSHNTNGCQHIDDSKTKLNSNYVMMRD